MHSDVEFVATDTVKGINYNWNFGDGTSSDVGYKVIHKYTKAGNYTVSLKVGNKSSSKEVQIFPGTLSYQIKNGSRSEVNLETYIDNPENFGSVSLNLALGTTSDQIFSKSNFIGGLNGGALAGIILTFNNIKYINRPTIWLKLFQNHVIDLNDDSEFLKMSSNDVGPDRIKLGEL
ncbi:PKD domain-containing protein [Rufibacter roseolus]|uniref:PKD domain-containing protein n=1 Tax=Rufibacter roseolus TaxID=2817375 RepID=UPI001B3003EB|nr:PKD domain-containing protein [Rufibacter roseolus]